MRKVLLGAAALIAIAAPGVAVANSGEVGLSFSNTDVDSVGDFDTLRLDGAFNHTTSGGFVLQFDAAHDRIDTGIADLGVGYGAVSFGTRTDGYAFYGFAGLSDFAALSGTNFGLGGQMYLGNITLNASAGWAELETADVSITNVNFNGTYFFTPNFGLGAEASWSEAELGPDVDWTTLGVNAVYRFAGSPFAIGAGYQWQEFDGGVDADTWRLRLSYNFGTGSELERSQSGASFDGARRLFEAHYPVIY